MPNDPLWINASAGAPSYTANELRQAMALAMQYNGRAMGARAGVRPGGTQLNVTFANPNWTVAPGVAYVDPALTTPQGGYWVAHSPATTGAATAAHATLARKDILVLHVYDNDEDASGLRQGVAEYVVGVAGSGVDPATPAGSFKLATLDVPSVAGGGLGAAAVTMSHPYTVAAGGIMPVRSTTDRATLTPHTLQMIGRLDTGLYEAWTGAAWRTLNEVIICTSATRPANSEGRVIYETDTDRILVNTGAAWRVIYMPPATADTNVAETTLATAYGNLSGGATGPAVTVSLEAGQPYTVIVSATIYSGSGASGQRAYAGYAVSGAEVDAATDVDAAHARLNANNIDQRWERASIYTPGTTGSHVFTMQYRLDAAVSTTFLARRITVKL